MSKSGLESRVAIAPKVILLIASVLCVVSAFVPWLDFGGGYSSDLGGLAPVFVVAGVVPAVLNVLALALKKHGIDLAANILGIVGGLVVLLYVAMFFLGSNMLGSDFIEAIMENLSFGVCAALVSGLLLFIASIVSIVKGKKK